MEPPQTARDKTPPRVLSVAELPQLREATLIPRKEARRRASRLSLIYAGYLYGWIPAASLLSVLNPSLSNFASLSPSLPPSLRVNCNDKIKSDLTGKREGWKGANLKLTFYERYQVLGNTLEIAQYANDFYEFPYIKNNKSRAMSNMQVHEF